MKLPKGAWVIVADGGRGILFENEGTPSHPELKTMRVYDQDNPRSSAQGEDKPPRGFSPAGGHRAAFEGTDLHQVQEDRFIDQIAADLSDDAAAHAFKHIVVVVPPAVLGKFRKACNGAFDDRVMLWIDKDLTKHPVNEILSAVAKALET